MTLDKVMQIRTDDEHANMLQELAQESGNSESEIVRFLIRQEWKKRKGIVEVPVVGKLNEKTIIAVGKSGPAFEKGE